MFTSQLTKIFKLLAAFVLLIGTASTLLARDPVFPVDPGNPFPPSPPVVPPTTNQYQDIICESWQSSYAECWGNGQIISNIWVKQQYSNRPCIYGQSFGLLNNKIWVNNGCRAEFTIEYRYQPPVAYTWITCESRNYNYTTCDTIGSQLVEVSLEQQLSNSQCIKNQSFGIVNNQVWVSNGCRGYFKVAYYGSASDYYLSCSNNGYTIKKEGRFVTVYGPEDAWIMLDVNGRFGANGQLMGCDTRDFPRQCHWRWEVEWPEARRGDRAQFWVSAEDNIPYNGYVRASCSLY